jgi:uncharacterized RmlC-like cupin family protein
MLALSITDAAAHGDWFVAGDLPATAAAAEGRDRPRPVDAGIATIRPSATTPTRQGLPNFAGISGVNAGAHGISMNLVIIPPGGSAKPHRHRGYETAIYLLKGRVRTRYGEGLCQEVVHEAGDFVFIPADVPHQPVNLSATEEVRAIVARTDPNEQESVELYDTAADACAP